MANDREAGGSALTATLVSAPAHGTLSLQADGTFTYRPAAGFVGADTFTYAADDGVSASAPVAVRIDVRDPAAGAAHSRSPA